MAHGPDDWLSIGETAIEMDVTEVAVAALAAVVHAAPGERDYWFDYGRALLTDGQAGESLGWLRGSLALNDDVDCWLLLAEAEVQAGETEAALRTLWAVVTRWPADGQGWYQLAMTLRLAGRHGRAAWALAHYAKRAEGLPAGERAAILAPLAGLAGTIEYYDGAWQPQRYHRQVYWRPSRPTRR
ncbi:MAG: hypothetical protein H7338_12910 [Candidatus Sericytochromatia bacterium]|nr:hypothetical protein [Candidatus Sericytochromatia bacterium]